MNREEALALLKIKEELDTEEIEEVFQNQVFEIKNFILRSVVIPKLFLPRIKKLNRLAEAFSVLMDEPFDSILTSIPDHFPTLGESLQVLNLNPNSTYSDLIRAYEQALVQAQFALSSTFEISTLIQAISKTIEVQLAYESVLWNTSSNIKIDSSIEAPKQQDQLGSVALKNLLDSSNQLDQSISNSLIDRDLDESLQIRLHQELRRIEVAKNLWK